MFRRSTLLLAALLLATTHAALALPAFDFTDSAGERLQAAGFCYAWEKVARLAGVDAFIYHRQVDHEYEGGLNLGLWRRKPGSVVTAGTPEQAKAFEFALPIVGLKRWDDLPAR